MHVVHNRLQHGVGQGGFHSAKVMVRVPNDTEYRFDYVYDCGAVAFGKKSPLMQSIQSLRLEPRAGTGKGVINALVLSHYDQDHIVGAKHLAKLYDVRRIFLPYLSQQEWMLVLASQADRWRDMQIRALHTLATGGGQLFGVDVTMVGPTGTQDDQADGPADQPFPPGDDPARPRDDQAKSPPLPKDLVAVAGGGAKPLGSTLPPGANVSLGVPGRTPQQMAWLLRFWNRGVRQDLLDDLSKKLKSCSFPMAALSNPKGAKDVLAWLSGAGQRDKAVAAYHVAVNATRPAKTKAVSASHIANHISMGLYSGPAEAFSWHHSCYSMRCWDDTGSGEGFWANRKCCLQKHHPRQECRTGWLGTGDAPLGQADVWADFEQRYRKQLEQTISIQVPHHGAAPKTGPVFFNPSLLPVSGMNAVLAAGTKNAYGHPEESVKVAIKKAGGLLQLVNELKRPGFEESLSYIC